MHAALTLASTPSIFGVRMLDRLGNLQTLPLQLQIGIRQVVPRCTPADQAGSQPGYGMELYDELSALQDFLDNAVRSANDLQQKSQRQKQGTEPEPTGGC
eukprot:3980540-Amphidinium_carterae.1